jgi:hypothetical protein
MDDQTETDETQLDPTLWKKNGWIARVEKNENDDGWAVSMTRIGDSEPALVGPWTMGRDKKNPKPLNPADFATLVKTASEVLERAAAQARARLRQRLTITAPDGARWRVVLDIEPDEDEPTATLTAVDEADGRDGLAARGAARFHAQRPGRRAAALRWSGRRAGRVSACTSVAVSRYVCPRGAGAASLRGRNLEHTHFADGRPLERAAIGTLRV